MEYGDEEFAIKFSLFSSLCCFWTCGSDDFVFLCQNNNMPIILGFCLCHKGKILHEKSNAENLVSVFSVLSSFQNNWKSAYIKAPGRALEHNFLGSSYSLKMNWLIYITDFSKCSKKIQWLLLSYPRKKSQYFIGHFKINTSSFYVLKYLHEDMEDISW